MLVGDLSAVKPRSTFRLGSLSVGPSAARALVLLTTGREGMLVRIFVMV